MFSWFQKLFKGDDETEESLKKRGFDPALVEAEDTQEVEVKVDSYELLAEGQFMKILNGYAPYDDLQDVRHPLGQPKGGIKCGNPEHVKKLRGVAKDMIKQIGRKIISGDFNLTKISFPMTAMIPQTSLDNVCLGSSMMPYFGTLAARAKDPVQRMKFAMASIISTSYAMNMFLKPLNPVLGETLQSKYPDGTEVYCQQICHHPPVTYFLVVGPQNSYRYYGYYNFTAKASLNSGVLTNTGKRYFETNGEVIEVNYSKEHFSHAFIGTLRLESQGNLTFTDNKNQIKAVVEFGKIKNKPSDYFRSNITQKGKSICQFDGTYLGYLNFDKTRYWDSRFLKALKTTKQPNLLSSDSSLRQDIIHFRNEDLARAQVQKDKLENIQRHDAKLRKKVSVSIE